jgi:hypothetical protein
VVTDLVGAIAMTVDVMVMSNKCRTSLALMTALTALIVAGPAYACSCMEPTPETAFGRATQVFAGRVTDIDKPFWDRIGLTKSGLWRVHFAVSKRWKGATAATITVRTRVTGESCGYPFRVGQAYLVYLAAGAEPVTGSCSGTKDLAHADRDLPVLDRLAAAASQR